MTVAEKILKPAKAGVFRIAFIYTGQGESTLLIIPTGIGVDDYKYVLIDCDKDNEKNEVNLVSLFKDLFKTKGELSIFINTHPHDDHIAGINEVYDQTKFKEVWHSNHKPGKKHADKYEDLKYVINKVGKLNEFHLKATDIKNEMRDINDNPVNKKIGKVDFIVLSPEDYLCEEIEDADADERYDRIHEQCGVLKFSYGRTVVNVLITGDSDKEAWKQHIVKNRKEDLSATLLSASHHGSHSFFKKGEDDKDVYEEHIKKIKPTYLIISAPKQDESPYGHPHEDALDIYKKYVDDVNILHLGKNPECILFDIDEDGVITITPDKQLIEQYGFKEEQKNENNGQGAPYIKKASTLIGVTPTKLDDKPMGDNDSLV